MPNYGEILKFLSENPPELASERQMHASLLELMAACLRSGETVESSVADQIQHSFSEDTLAQAAGQPS